MVIRNTAPRKTSAYFSNAWTRLCPKNAITTCATTTIASPSSAGIPVSAASANAPLTLFTANHPMPAVMAFKPAGRMLPQ